MGIGVSLILAAAGAVLIWAVDATVSGVNIHVVGWILLIVGAVGFIVSMALLDSWRSRGTVARRRARYIDEDDPEL